MRRQAISLFLVLAAVAVSGRQARAGGLGNEFPIDTSHAAGPSYGSNPGIAFDGTDLLAVWADARKGTDYDVFGMLVRPDGTVLDSAGIAIATGSGNDLNPAAAFNGSYFLVVWTDDSTGLRHVYAARVATDGALLDSAPIPIAPGENSQEDPAVTSDGSDFLVAWTLNSTDRDVYVARVAASGAVLDPEGIPVSTEAGDQSQPCATFDGTNYVVAWSDARVGWTDIYAARVTPAGIVLDTGGIALSKQDYEQARPAVAVDSAGTLVVWADWRSDESGIYGARLARDGTVLDTAGIPISVGSQERARPRVACLDTEFFVAWADLRSDAGMWQVYGARVTGSGVVLDSGGIPVAAESAGTENAAVTSDGADFQVMWNAGCGLRSCIYANRVSPAGVLLDPNAIEISTGTNGQRNPAAAHDNANFLAVWQDYRHNPDCDIYAARVSPSGVALDPAGFPVSTAPNDQVSPAVAFGGTNYLIVWQDGRTGSLRPSANGRQAPAASRKPSAIDQSAAGRQLSAPPNPGPRFRAVIPEGDRTRAPLRSGVRNPVADKAATAKSAFRPRLRSRRAGRRVPSDETYHLFAARVTPAGQVLDPQGIELAGPQPDALSDPALAFGDSDYLMAWGDNSGIYAARVTQSGVVRDTAGIPLGFGSFPAVAFDGTNFLIAYLDMPAVKAARVTQAGQVLDTAGIIISNSGGYEGYSAAAFDGTDFLVVWADSRNDSFPRIYAARISPAGRLLDSAGIMIDPGPARQYWPSVVRDGVNSLVVWTDYRSGDYPELYGAHLSPGGAVLDTFLVSSQPGPRWASALTRGAGGQVFLACAGWAGTVAGRSLDNARIWGVLGPFGGVAGRPVPPARSVLVVPGIVRGVLNIGARPAADSLRPLAALLDIAGRRVMELRPGPNDVSRVAAGVYFVVPFRGAGQPAERASKVVVTR